MKSIDVHAHLTVKELLRDAGHPEDWRYVAVDDPDGPTYFTRGPDTVPCRYEALSVDGIVPAFDALGIDLAAISLAPYQFHYDLPPAVGKDVSRVANEALARAVTASAGKLIGLATLPMQDVALAVEELAWVTAQPEFVGLELATNVMGHYLGEDQFRPLWEAIEEADVPVFLHPNNVIGKESLGPYFLSNLIGNPVESTRSVADIIFSGLLERHPKLKICIAHGGGAAPYLIGRWDRGFDRRPRAGERITEAPSEYLKRLYFDHITHSTQALRYLIEVVGVEQVMIGTDYPFDMGPDEPVDDIERLTDLDAETRDLLRGGNAARFLSIEGGTQS